MSYSSSDVLVDSAFFLDQLRMQYSTCDVAAGQQCLIDVYVTHAMSGSKVCDLQVPAQFTIKEVKLKIWAKHKAVAHSAEEQCIVMTLHAQQLLHENKVLDNSQRIGSLGNRLHLKLLLRPLHRLTRMV